MRPTDALLHRRLLLDYSREVVQRNPGSEDHLVGVIRDLLEITSDCDVYYVSADMVAVAKAAAGTMPQQELRRDDLPSERGFMMFDQPIGQVVFPDDESAPVEGFAWQVGGEVDILEHAEGCQRETTPECGNCGNDAAPCGIFDGVDETVAPPEVLAQLPRCMRGKCVCEWMPRPVIGRGAQVDVYPLGRFPDSPSQLMPLVSAEGSWWRPSWTLGEPPTNDLNGLCRPLLATWTLMQQSLSVSERLPGDRAERRRCARANLPSDVLIVRLRRRSLDSETDDTEAGVPWSHRWLVGGHWRNQWLPSRGAHRLQWIAGYVKGPASMPLMIKDRVKAWVR